MGDKRIKNCQAQKHQNRIFCTNLLYIQCLKIIINITLFIKIFKHWHCILFVLKKRQNQNIKRSEKSLPRVHRTNKRAVILILRLFLQQYHAKNKQQNQPPPLPPFGYNVNQQPNVPNYVPPQGQNQQQPFIEHQYQRYMQRAQQRSRVQRQQQQQQQQQQQAQYNAYRQVPAQNPFQQGNNNNNRRPVAPLPVAPQQQPQQDDDNNYDSV